MFSRLNSSSSRQIVCSSVRTLSSKAPTVSHEPPKKIHGIVGRYASALYTSASKASSLDKVEGELQAIADVMTKVPGFAAFLSNPTVSRGEKVTRVGSLIDEKKFSHITRNLIVTLAANGKSADLPKVIAAYDDLIQTSKGVVRAVVISAEPLKKKQLDSIEAAIKTIAGAGKSVLLSAEVNESILGGIQVMVGDKFLDLSIKSRVHDLSAALEGGYEAK